MLDIVRVERYMFVELCIFWWCNIIIFKIFFMILVEVMIGIRICFIIIWVICRDVVVFLKFEEMFLFLFELFVVVFVMFGRIVVIIDIVVNV